MIFIALGTQKFQFNRLLKYVDDMKEKEIIKSKVVAQIGFSDYVPKNYEYRDFFEKKEFEGFISNCNLLITHSGVATIMSGIKERKAVIVVPRDSKYGEHVDNHQFEIANSFSKSGYVKMCTNYEELLGAYDQINHIHFNQYDSKKDLINGEIINFIESLK